MLREYDKEDYGWEAFKLYAEQNSINLEDKEDWEAWWNCWKMAITVYDEFIKEFRREKEEEPYICPHSNTYVDTSGWHCVDCGESASPPLTLCLQ